MDTNKNKDIENLFQSGFNQAEVPYDEGAWEQMELLLDSKKKRFLFWAWFSNKSNTFKIISIMTLLTILTSVGMLLSTSSNLSDGTINNNTSNSVTKNTELKSSTSNLDKLEANNQNSKAYLDADSSLKKGVASAAGIGGGLATLKTLTEIKRLQTKVADIKKGEQAGTGLTAEDKIALDEITKKLTALQEQFNSALSSANLASSSKQSVKIVRKTWVEPEYEEEWGFEDKGPIQDFWLGFYYTQQALGHTFKNGTSGFNMQLMSGNLIKSNDFGFYAGLDWGMLFYGKTAKSNVVINTVNQDSGFTRLRNNSFDLHAKFHFEYAKGPIVPYITGHFGPRFYYTNQRVASYLNLSDNESSTSNNADFSTSLTAGLGLGTRIKIAPRISLDARYEVLLGTKANQVNLQNSTFNGLNYQLSKNRISPEFSAFRVGVVFDLSEGSNKKTLVKEGYYKEIVDSMIVENSSSDSSSIIVLPCNCECDERKKASSSMNKVESYSSDSTVQRRPVLRILKDLGEAIDDIDMNTGGSGGSSGGKGSFPGIGSGSPVLK